MSVVAVAEIVLFTGVGAIVASLVIGMAYLVRNGLASAEYAEVPGWVAALWFAGVQAIFLSILVTVAFGS